MGEIVNLRRARKNKARFITTSEAAANRTKFGRSRAEAGAADMLRALDTARLEGHKRSFSEASTHDNAD
jgi:hypothetical protein